MRRRMFYYQPDSKRVIDLGPEEPRSVLLRLGFWIALMGLLLWVTK